jgi:putative ABC transport system permease protein
MFLLRTIQLGMKNLRVHPMRSLLTVLGIFIGVASVIWLLAIGEGISQEAQRQIEGLGADNIIVRSIKPPSEVLSAYNGPVAYGLKRDDFDLLVSTIPTITSALPIREIRRTFSFDGRNEEGRLVGCTPEYFDVMLLALDRGRLLTEADVDGVQNYCVLSSGIAERLFPYEDPIGHRVFLAETKDFYHVIGILNYRTPTAAIGGSLEAQDFNTDVYIPISTLRQRVGDLVVTRRGISRTAEVVELNQITLRVSSIKDVAATAVLVRDLLHVPDPANANDPDYKAAVATTAAGASSFDEPMRLDVAVIVPEELLEQARMTKLMFMVLMGMIAAISLLVGGIGIMNIMLATVTERTQEIGIRRALGATRLHIITQFLVETISLSIVGGVTGILAGLLCPITTTSIRDFLYVYAPNLMRNLPAVVRHVQPQIVLFSLPLAFGISGLNRISNVPMGMDFESLVDSILDHETATGRMTCGGTPIRTKPHRLQNKWAVAQAVSAAAGWLGLGLGLLTGAGR